MQHFCENVARPASLDDVYNAFGSFAFGAQRILPLGAKPDFFSDLYLGGPNGQGVRNRYRVVYWQIKKLLESADNGRILSIACGSAQPIIHAIYRLAQEGIKIKAVLTDADETSLALARERARQAGVVDMISFRQIPFLKLPKIMKDEEFDIIEACGILDYLDDRLVSFLLKFALGDILKETGAIIVSNMAKTRAANLLRKMYNWEIIYRKPEELGRLIEKAGGKNIKIFVEPWVIHPVATATK